MPVLFCACEIWQLLRFFWTFLCCCGFTLLGTEIIDSYPKWWNNIFFFFLEWRFKGWAWRDELTLPDIKWCNFQLLAFCFDSRNCDNKITIFTVSLCLDLFWGFFFWLEFYEKDIQIWASRLIISLSFDLKILMSLMLL